MMTRFVLALVWSSVLVLTSSARSLSPGARALPPILRQGEAAILSGTVVDPRGEPVSGARLSAYLDDERPMPFTVAVGTSDERGRFELQKRARGRAYLEVEARGYLTQRIDLEPVRAGETLETRVVLQPVATIRGRVLWPDGSPVKRAMVKACVLGADPEARTFLTKSEADGAFELGDLPWESFDLVAQITRKVDEGTFPKRRVRYSTRAAGVAAGASDLTLTLSAGHALRGRLVDAQGAAVQEFDLSVERPPEIMPKERPLTFRTGDEAGTFQVDGATDGPWELTASSEGLEPVTVRVEVAGADLELGSLALAPALPLGGVVLDDRGRPVPRARVELRSAAEPRYPPGDGFQSTVADDEGRFRFEHVNVGEVALSALGPRESARTWSGGSELYVDVQPRAELADLTLQLLRPGSLRVRVQGPTGQPLGDRAVRLDLRGEEQRTNAAGLVLFQELSPDEYGVSVRVEPEDPRWDEPFEILSRRTEVRSGEVADVVVEVPRLRPVLLRGRLLLGGAPPDFRAAVVTTGITFERSVAVDAAGGFELRLPWPGPCIVWWQLEAATHRVQGGAHFELPEVEEHELQLDWPLATLRGSVRDAAGRPVPGARVLATPERTDAAPVLISGTMTLEDGTFELRPAPVGAFELVASSAGSADTRLALSLEPGEERGGVDLVLAPGGAVRGVVVDADGYALEAREVVVRRPDGHEHVGALLPDGAFELEGLPLGPVELTAVLPGWRCPSITAQVTAAPDDPPLARLRMLRAAWITLRVPEAAAGIPDDAWTVSLEPPGARVLRVHGDTWKLGPLEPGTYTVTAAGPAGSASERVEIQGTTPVALELGPR